MELSAQTGIITKESEAGAKYKCTDTDGGYTNKFELRDASELSYKYAKDPSVETNFFGRPGVDTHEEFRKDFMELGDTTRLRNMAKLKDDDEGQPIDNREAREGRLNGFVDEACKRLVNLSGDKVIHSSIACSNEEIVVSFECSRVENIPCTYESTDVLGSIRVAIVRRIGTDDHRIVFAADAGSRVSSVSETYSFLGASCCVGGGSSASVSYSVVEDNVMHFFSLSTKNVVDSSCYLLSAVKFSANSASSGISAAPKKGECCSCLPNCFSCSSCPNCFSCCFSCCCKPPDNFLIGHSGSKTFNKGVESMDRVVVDEPAEKMNGYELKLSETTKSEIVVAIHYKSAQKWSTCKLYPTAQDGNLTALYEKAVQFVSLANVFAGPSSNEPSGSRHNYNWPTQVRGAGAPKEEGFKLPMSW